MNVQIAWADRLPDGWRGARLRWLSRIYAGGTPDRERPDFWTDGTVPWLNSGAVNDWAITQPSARITTQAMASSSAKWIREKSVVMALAGQGRTKGTAARLEFRSTCNQSMAAIVPGPDLDYRYLHYWLASNYERIRNLSGGDARDGLNLQHVGSIECPVPPTGVQRRVADFLDDRVSRIDEAVRLRREQIEALDNRVAVAMDVALVQRGWEQPTSLEAEAVQSVPDGWRVARLSQVLRQLTNGYVGPTRDILTDEGVRYIQGMHIKGGVIDFDRRHFFVSEAWHAARPRIHLRKGDVLIVQTGDIGRVAVVPPGFGEASCHALQIARVHEHVLSGEYLGAFLGSSFGYHSLLSRATGALHPHLEGGIRSVPVVIPPSDEQWAIVDEVSATRESAQEAQAVMRQQMDLLEERKRSLITAAVTGEFDVTTASGRAV